MALSSPPRSASPPTGGITLWPAEVLASHLVSEDPLARTMALGMAVQPGAPIDRCVEALVECAALSRDNALASQLAATALGSLPIPALAPTVAATLADLAAASQPMPVRIAAAHALFRLASLPPAAHDAVCAMLVEPDGNARKVALLAVQPFARDAAAAIARQAVATAPVAWTVELLQALVASAGDDASARGKVEAFVVRSLRGVPLVPAGIAGQACLARLDPKGSATAALLQVAGDAGNAQASQAALEALAALGESAQAAAPGIAQMLVETEDPVREELLCRTLVRLRTPVQVIPLARVLQRVRSAPERSTAAHCLLLCLHPKEFAQAAALVRQRFQAAGQALQKTLAQTYKTLTGTELTGDAVAQKV
jgi:hypothetical protein